MKRFLTIQEHDAEKAGLHWDLRLSKENGPSEQVSWVVPKHRLPEVNETLLAIKVDDHPWHYRNFEGELKEGYGKGTVKLIHGDYTEVKRWELTRVTFYHKGRKYCLRKGNGKKWFLLGAKNG